MLFAVHTEVEFGFSDALWGILRESRLCSYDTTEQTVLKGEPAITTCITCTTYNIDCRIQDHIRHRFN